MTSEAGNLGNWVGKHNCPPHIHQGPRTRWKHGNWHWWKLTSSDSNACMGRGNDMHPQRLLFAGKGYMLTNDILSSFTTSLPHVTRLPVSQVLMTTTMMRMLMMKLFSKWWPWPSHWVFVPARGEMTILGGQGPRVNGANPLFLGKINSRTVSTHHFTSGLVWIWMEHSLLVIYK